MQIVCQLMNLFLILIFVRVVLSWFPVGRDGPLASVVGILYKVTDPVMEPLRKVIPPVRMGTMALDLSPIIVIIGLQVIQGQIC